MPAPAGARDGWTRRGVVAGATALLALGPTQPSAQTSGAEPAGADDPWQNWSSPTNRLVRRVTMGITAPEAAKAARIGFGAYLEEQLNPQNIDDSRVDVEVAARWPRTTWPVTKLSGLNDDWRTIDQLQQSTIYRAVRSKKQLQERMVEFWRDHFSITTYKVPGAQMVPFMRDVVRPMALSKFPQLLRGVVGHVAMLSYLDNVYNFGDAPNINFARELLELHTVSPASGYTTQDIKNLARIFTGWSVNEGFLSLGDRGKFQYRPELHSVGDKVVMGHFVPNGQQSEGENICAWLGLHPWTAQFLCTKLAKWFLGDSPPASLIQSAVNVYLSTLGDMRAVLRVLLTPETLMAAQPKLKRPFHLVVSSLRSTNAKLKDLNYLKWIQLEALGQVPFTWEPPDGFPDRTEYWAASMRPRLQYCYNLGNDEVWGVTIHPWWKLDTLTTDDVVNSLDKALCGGEMSNRDRNSVRHFVQSQPLFEHRVRAAHSIALSSPSFQWY